MNKKYYNNIGNPELLVFIIIFLVTTFISILGGIVLFFCYLLLYKNSYSKFSFIYVSYVYAIIAFTQYSTINTTNYDIIRYYTTYHFFSDLDFKDGWQAILIHGDIFFYAIVYILSKLFPEDPRILSFFFTFVTSTLLFLSIDNFVFKYSSKKRYNLFSVIFWIFSFFLISSFPNMTNVYRQFFATALLLYGISRKEVNKKYLIFFILAVLSHWSMIIYMLLYLVIDRFKRKLNIVLIMVPVFSILINLVLPNLNFSNRINSYLFGEEILGVDKTILVISIILQCIIIYVLSRYKNSIHTLYTLSILSISYNVVFILNSTIVTRHFFYIGFLITMIYIIFGNSLPKLFLNNKKRIPFDILILLLVFYNGKSLILGGSTYLIFENKGIVNSFLSFLNSPFPYEIIR